MEFFNKLNGGQRLAAIGAIVIIISWLVAIVAGGAFGIGVLPLLGAVAVLVIYYLQYSPNQHVNWPAPVPLLVLGIAAVVALLAVINALTWLSAIGLLGFGLLMLVVIGTAVGAVIMAWGAWQDYQATPRATPPTSNTPPTA